MSRYDTVVIGAGLAGLTTACQLVQANQKVLLVSSGIGALLLASGCIDVLGFQPADSSQPVRNPLASLDNFLAEHPDHPYHFVGQENIQPGLTAFLKMVNQDSLEYRGSADQNWLLPSAAGAIHPTCLAPASLANGDLKEKGRVLIVGFKELRDFYPTLISDNLNAQDLGLETTALTINAPAPVTGKMNITPIELARTFEQPDFRRKLVEAIKSESKNYGRVGFPAVLGLQRHAEVMADLQKQLNQTMFEISALPPSVPGRRLFEGLKHIFLQASGRMIIGSKVVAGTIEAGRVVEIQIETASRLKSVQADNYVLATGGIFGGGIQTNDEARVWEPIFDLPIAAEANRHKWFSKSFLSPEGQPVANYGVKVNQQLQPVDENNATIAKNLYAVGAVIAGSEWTRGRTGDGLAVITAAAAVKAITS